MAVHLSRATEEDLETLRTWRNNPLIMGVCRQPMPLSMEEQYRWFKRISESSNDYVFTIYNNSERVGYCALYGINPVVRNAEFSIYIAPGKQKNGYGRDALLQLLRYGFYSLGLNKIESETWETNIIGLRTFVNIGFKQEGRIRDRAYKNGKHIDAIWIGMLREDYDLLYGEENACIRK